MNVTRNCLCTINIKNCTFFVRFHYIFFKLAFSIVPNFKNLSAHSMKRLKNNIFYIFLYLSRNAENSKNFRCNILELIKAMQHWLAVS